MGHVCSMVWNSQPSYGAKQRRKFFKPSDFMSRRPPAQKREKRDPLKASANLDKRLASFQRAQQRALGKRPKDE